MLYARRFVGLTFNLVTLTAGVLVIILAVLGQLAGLLGLGDGSAGGGGIVSQVVALMLLA